MSEQAESGAAALPVSEVARELGVTSRAVLKLLHSGRLRGSKQGKRWRVDAASLAELVRDRRSPAPPARRTGDQQATPPAESSLPLPPRPPRRTRRAGDEPYTFTQLGAWERLYPVAIEALQALDTERAGAEHLVRDARDAVVAALTHLAQGYHCYHRRDKVAHYASAREALCAGACTLTILAGLHPGEGARLRQLADDLQGEPLGSLAGLIRVTERRKGRSRSERGQQDGAAEAREQQEQG